MQQVICFPFWHDFDSFNHESIFIRVIKVVAIPILVKSLKYKESFIFEHTMKKVQSEEEKMVIIIDNLF